MGVDERPSPEYNEFTAKLEEHTCLENDGLTHTPKAKELRRGMELLSPRDPVFDFMDMEQEQRETFKTLGKQYDQDEALKGPVVTLSPPPKDEV